MKSNQVVKTIFFILLLLVVLVLFLVIFIIPEMKVYKTNHKALKQYEKIYNKKVHDLKRLKSKKEQFQRRYKIVIKKYNQKFDLSDFKNYISSSCQECKISQSKDNKNLNLEILVKDKKDFFKFIEKLNKYKNIVKINFPIVYKITNKTIKINFSVDISNI